MRKLTAFILNRKLGLAAKRHKNRKMNRLQRNDSRLGARHPGEKSGLPNFPFLRLFIPVFRLTALASLVSGSIGFSLRDGQSEAQKAQTGGDSNL
jgi:hypothetical protein